MSHPPTLRRGWTTGTCATAAAKAAATALLTGRFADPVTVTLPRGGTATFPLAAARLERTTATATVIKDAGDDPDVTHLCRVVASLRLQPTIDGVTFAAGEGVGTVTRAGLPIPTGEPAINPVPRQMIRQALAEVCDATATATGFAVTLAIPGGGALAAKTLNPRLGIVGGLSILGTTGVVVPFSCAAWIHSIHRGIDVARAAGLDHVAAATGSTSEAAIQRRHQLADPALIEMGDFAGATLKYLRRHPVRRLSLAGGFAKLAKFALGATDLHSGRSTLNQGALADLAQAHGLTPSDADRIRHAGSGGEALASLGPTAPHLARAVATTARTQALQALDHRIAVEVVVYDRAGEELAAANGW
ncbi:MAG: cobalt-precorrin-5B (C(1))-methyltransferase [Geminicoccaceae bacterium]|nr:MAG: cobalt-precorrin-5B (C(1))-methyltransferase [Geminicoccaceae bacterium]